MGLLRCQHRGTAPVHNALAAVSPSRYHLAPIAAALVLRRGDSHLASFRSVILEGVASWQASSRNYARL